MVVKFKCTIYFVSIYGNSKVLWISVFENLVPTSDTRMTFYFIIALITLRWADFSSFVSDKGCRP